MIPDGDGRSYLIKGGAVITVDPVLGTLPLADVLVRNGVIERIGPDLAAESVENIDAADMIVMPGLIDTHYHMWSTLGRNFISDRGFGYYPAKWATAHLYNPEDFYNSVLLGLAELAAGGVTTVHNWSHNSRSPAHTDAELRAHGDSRLRARYSLGHIDKLSPEVPNRFDDVDRVISEWFAASGPLQGLVHLGVNLRGMVQSEPWVFHQEMAEMLCRSMPVSIHATQTRPNLDDAADYEERGYLGPNFLISHYIAASPSDYDCLARTRTPLSFATLSEIHLGEDGDPRAALLKMRAAGVSISLSSDATSLAPPNMFETMRATWNMGIPWRGTDTAHLPPVGIYEVIELATIRGAEALGLGGLTGSLTPGKRADIILVDTNDINLAPMANIETTIVQSAVPANVDTVMVDGRIVKRGKQLVGFDTDRIVSSAKRSALRIRNAAGGILEPFCSCYGTPIFRGREPE